MCKDKTRKNEHKIIYISHDFRKQKLRKINKLRTEKETIMTKNNYV